MASFLAAKIGDPAYWGDVGNGALSAVFGILLVLVVLCIMIGILYAFQAIFVAIGKKTKSKKAKEPSDEQIQAAITAAISEYRGDDEVKVKITSIKKL